MKHCVSAIAFMAAVAAKESGKDMALISKVLISKVTEEVFITKKADRSSSGTCIRLW